MMDHKYDSLDRWLENTPDFHSGRFADDIASLRFWRVQGADIVRRSTSTTRAEDAHRSGNRRYVAALAELRSKFTAIHGAELYRSVTRGHTDFLRIEAFLEKAARSYPDLFPTAAELEEDLQRRLSDKYGHELTHGLVLAELLAIPEVGRHLLAAMRRPRATSHAALMSFKRNGKLDLGVVTLRRRGRCAELTLSNQRYLNAEDNELVVAMETAVDVALLDTEIDVGLIRGGVMSHEKYRGQRVFCSGVNLTKLHAGKLPFDFYVSRELGLMSKIYRGLSTERAGWASAVDHGLEKPWIAAVDKHAIGGGGQLLLVVDYVIAESSAYLTIPANSEGFIPGLANLRLPRFFGKRLAEEIVFRHKKIQMCDPQARLLVNEVVSSDSMDIAIDRAIQSMSGTELPGFRSNRKAFRLGDEPLDTFRAYMATFCREQASRMFGEEILPRLERWMNRSILNPSPDATLHLPVIF